MADRDRRAAGVERHDGCPDLDVRPSKLGLFTDAAEWTAPPSGLFLERVLYPGDPPLGPVVPVVPVPPEEW